MLQSFLNCYRSSLHFDRCLVVTAPPVAMAYGLGILGGISVGSVGLVAGVISGGVVGVIFNLGMQYSLEVSGLSEQRQYALMNRLITDASLSKEVKQVAVKINKFVARTPVFLDRSHDLHAFHADVHLLSKNFSNNPMYKLSWDEVLKRMQHLSVRDPRGNLQKIDTFYARKILWNHKISYSINLLDPKSSEAEKEIEDCVHLHNECFAVFEDVYKQFLRKILRNPNITCFVAKDIHTKEVIGFIWGKRDDPKLPVFRIHGLGRKASAARLGIGD
ncbi:MAG: GNAT family N-acetyltransferase, partial [Chlamydiae bacterium]|nr:GNAT family N-acetyltransferase [Chlamydiota bacterium]